MLHLPVVSLWLVSTRSDIITWARVRSMSSCSVQHSLIPEIPLPAINLTASFTSSGGMRKPLAMGKGNSLAVSMWPSYNIAKVMQSDPPRIEESYPRRDPPLATPFVIRNSFMRGTLRSPRRSRKLRDKERRVRAASCAAVAQSFRGRLTACRRGRKMPPVPLKHSRAFVAA